MKRIRCLLFLIVIFCLVSTPSGAVTDTSREGWELVMDKNGIKAYARKVEGSGIFEFRAVMVADARAEVVAEALRDTPAMTEWLPHCDKSYILEMKDRDHFSDYISLDLPWPVKDRDLVIDTITRYDFVHARAVTDFFDTEITSCPPRDSHIRMPDLKGQYVFEFVTREKTGIVHTYRADIGGSLPEWMANLATKYNIYNTFLNLQKMFKNEKYINLSKTSPDRELCERFLGSKQQVQESLVARLREFIHDSDFVDMIRDSRNVDEVLDVSDGRISETLLYGWGSDESKKKAIKVILETYLCGHTENKELINTVLNDNNLADTILNGPQGRKSSRQIIEAYLKTGVNTAAGN